MNSVAYDYGRKGMDLRGYFKKTPRVSLQRAVNENKYSCV